MSQRKDFKEKRETDQHEISRTETDPMGLATWTFLKIFKRGSNRGTGVVLQRAEGVED